MVARQVLLRTIAVGVAFGYVVVLAVVAVLVKTETSESSWGYLSENGAHSSSVTVTIEESLWSAQGAPVAVVLGLLALACGVAAASLAWRVGRRSPQPGIAGLVAAGLVGLVAVLGLLSVGVFLLPVVALLVFAALPLSAFTAPVEFAAQ